MLFKRNCLPRWMFLETSLIKGPSRSLKGMNTRFQKMATFIGFSPTVRAGFNCREKKRKALINLRKSENDALKVRSVKNSKSLLECPRSLRLLLSSTQKC